jgi:DNA primase
VDKNLKALRAQLSTLHDNVEQMMQVMGEYKRMQDIRNVLARRLGSDIVV